MPDYLITRIGAQHRRKVNGSWVTLGKGDSINLTREQYDSGRFSHLGLHHLGDLSSSTAVELARPSAVVNEVDQIEDANRDGGTQTKAPGSEENNGPTSLDTIDALIKQVDESTTQPQLDEARDAMTKSGLFGDKVEGKKADLQKMLADKKAELSAPAQQ